MWNVILGNLNSFSLNVPKQIHLQLCRTFTVQWKILSHCKRATLVFCYNTFDGVIKNCNKNHFLKKHFELYFLIQYNKKGVCLFLLLKMQFQVVKCDVAGVLSQTSKYRFFYCDVLFYCKNWIIVVLISRPRTGKWKLISEHHLWPFTNNTLYMYNTHV